MSESSAFSIFHIILSYPIISKRKGSNVNLVTNAIACENNPSQKYGSSNSIISSSFGVGYVAMDPVIGFHVTPLTGGPVIPPVIH